MAIWIIAASASVIAIAEVILVALVRRHHAHVHDVNNANLVAREHQLRMDAEHMRMFREQHEAAIAKAKGEPA